jgi:uncharacterized protein (DUF2147 family)
MPVKTAVLTALAALAAGAALADLADDPAVGVWKTPPDRKDLVSHIEIAPCGEGALCGRVLRSFNQAGERVETPNIGKRIFWDVEPLGGGDYGKGTAWVPLLNVNARANMTLKGDTLKVQGCKLAVCDSQTWTRLR